MKKNRKNDVFGRAYQPDVFEKEEAWREKNPGWVQKYVDRAEAEEAEEGYLEYTGEPRHENDWKKDPIVAPSQKGFYDDYRCYRNEYRKIPVNRRRDYAFPFVDDTFAVVKPGEYSPVDGRTVTEEDIAYLHRARDREVYRNNKIRHQQVYDYDFLDRVEDEREKMLKGLPNCFEELREKVESVRLIINTGAFVDENGEDITDHMMAFASGASVEAQLGLTDNPLRDAFEEVEAQMDENEREVFNLVYRKGLPRTTVAKMLGVSESTVRYRLKKAVDKVKSNPVIARTRRIYEEQYVKITQWQKEQKEKKKRYEERHKGLNRFERELKRRNLDI